MAVILVHARTAAKGRPGGARAAASPMLPVVKPGVSR